jgi:glycosidase
MDDIIGSPYAVVDYVVNSELGTAADLASVRSQLNALGIALMLDFVPNHSAVDSPWTSNSPSYYVNAPTSIPYDPADYIKVAGGATLAFGADPYDGAWTDVVQFNYWNPATRAAMASALVKVAAAADMARCDMAMLMVS